MESDASEPDGEPDAAPDADQPVEARLVAPPPGPPRESVDPRLEAPQWLHPTSILFELLSTLRQFLFAAVLALFLASSGNRYAVVAAGLAVVITGSQALLRFLTLRYQLIEGELRIDEGLVFRRHRTVPVGRIQNIDLLQNPLHHALGVAEVRIETAAGNEPEAKLRVLSLADVERLRRAVFRPLEDASAARSGATSSAEPSISNGSIAADGSTGSENAWHGADEANGPAAGVDRRAQGGGRADTAPQWSYSIPTRRLIGAGLLSNRGLLLIPILFGVAAQFDLERRIDFRHVPDLLPRDFATATGVIAMVALVLGVLAVLRIASVGWFLFRFYGYSLRRYGEDLRISCGLFTRVSATVPRHRIQFISVQQTLLGRFFGLATLRIETAGGGGEQNEDAAVTVARRWFVPVMRAGDAADILAQLRPDVPFEPEQFAWQGTSPRTAWRLSRIAMLRAAVVAAIGALIHWPWGALAGVAVLPPLVYLALRYARSLQYARGDRWIAFRSGIVTRKTSLTFLDKVQIVAARQSPFDRRWEMATLEVDTAAAGPAQHRIEVKYLPSDVAFAEATRIAAQASQTLTTLSLPIACPISGPSPHEFSASSS